MLQTLWVCLLTVLFSQCLVLLAQTNSDDGAPLSALAANWQNKPSNWNGNDPCGGGWVGIKCNNTRVVSIQLSSMGLTGTLSGDILSLSELQTLDLSYNVGLTGTLPPLGKLTKLTNLILVGCGFSGEIPDLGSLQQLVYLSLNFNQFTGGIPPSIGYLKKLYWLDLADNKLTGSIPVFDGKNPGLDNLTATKHFHFGNNQLSGSIPPQLFSSNMHLIHVLFDSNNLTGGIPSTLGLVKSLEVVRLDRNNLNGLVPTNINNLTSVGELYLCNNKLTGPLPDLTGMNALNSVDLSNNTFDASDVPPWLSELKSLTTLVLESLRIGGEVPPLLFSLPQLQTVRMKNNLFNGTLNINIFGSQLRLVDMQNNKIEYIVQGGQYNKDLLLAGNPYCAQKPDDKSCRVPLQSAPTYSTSMNCADVCSSGQIISPKCKCAYPYLGTLYFRAPSFSDLENSSNFKELESRLMENFNSNQVSVDSVYLYNLFIDSKNYLRASLRVFPTNDVRFTPMDISMLGFILSNQTFKPPKNFGPFFFIGQPYDSFSATSGSNSTNLPLIIGASVGGLFAVLVIIVLVVYAMKQKKKARKSVGQGQPFASWDPNKSSGSIPQLKGARWFSFAELKRMTNNFSEANDLGAGGYGKVYKGTLENGQLVAVKRAQQGSMQGGLEFKTEIELLSRVHHKNLVSLVGFCFDQGEQMLIYEYVANGSLRDSLIGSSGVRLDWKRRLRVALGAARGLTYLHELADPPIVHRDVKSSNILLDDRLNAKVADFGLSKLLGDDQKGHVTTQVKGTMGYLDPEYYMTQQLTEKSDVYGFGVLMLELITARKPIERGRYIVREVKVAMDKSQDLYGLGELVDPAIDGALASLPGFEKFVDLALHCVEESGVDRPTMSAVVKEIEAILQSAGVNPNADSTPTSASYEATSPGYYHHPYSNEALHHGNSGPPPMPR